VEMAEFLKENFDKRSVLDREFLEDLRQVSMIGRSNSYIDSIECRFGSFKDINTCAIYIEEKIRVFIFNKFLQYLKYIRKYKVSLSLDVLKLFNYVGIFHEIMHSYQLDVLLNDNSDDTLCTIIKHSLTVSGGDISLSGKKVFSYDVKKALELYQKIYFLFPEERQSQLSSLYFMFDVYRGINPKNFKALYDIYKVLIYYGIREYIFKDKVSCPLLRFYSIIDKTNLFYKLRLSEYSLKVKFMYGMPLTREELYMVCYPFVRYNDEGEIFFERESVARRMWEKRYVK